MVDRVFRDRWLSGLEDLIAAVEPECTEEELSAWQRLLSDQLPELSKFMDQIVRLLEVPAGVATPGQAAVGLDVRNPVIVVGSSPAWRQLACIHGILHGQAVCNLRQTASLAHKGAVDSLTFVGPPQLFDDLMLRRIMIATGQSTAPFCQAELPWGILTARDFPAAVRLVLRSARARLSPSPARRVLVTHAEPLTDIPTAPPPDLVLLNQKDTFVNNIVDSVLEPTDLLSIVAHGRDDVLWVRRGLICGRAPGEPARDAEKYGGLPSCAYAGQCYKPDRTLLDASQLSATVVFLNTCSALKLNTAVYPLKYNVVLRLLDGNACAVIASPFMTNGKLWQNLLFYFLAGAGMPIGEALMSVNNATAASGLDFPGTVLVGDPLLSLRPVSQPEYRTTKLKDGWLIEGGGAHFVDLPADSSVNQADCFLAPASDRFSHLLPVYYAMNRRNGSARLYLFSLQALPPALTVRIGQGDPMSELRALSSETTTGIQGAEWMGIRDQKLERLGSELRNSLRSLRDVAQDQRYSLSAAATAQRRTRRFRQLRDQAETLLMDWLVQRTHHDSMQLYEMYRRGYSAEHWQWTTDLCRECNEPLVRFRVTSHIVEGFDRLVELCSTCGIVTDGDGRLDLWFEGDSSLYRTVVHTMDVCVRNNASRPLDGLLDVALVNGAMYGVTVCDSRHRFQLSAQQTGRFEFRIRASEETPPHHFWLRCYAVSSGLIYAGIRNVWIKP